MNGMMNGTTHQLGRGMIEFQTETAGFELPLLESQREIERLIAAKPDDYLAGLELVAAWVKEKTGAELNLAQADELRDQLSTTYWLKKKERQRIFESMQKSPGTSE